MMESKYVVYSLVVALMVALAGCSAFAGGSTEGMPGQTPESTPEVTPELTQDPTPETTATEGGPVTTEVTEAETEPTDDDELSKAGKFDVFDNHVEYAYEKGGDDVPRLVDTESYPENDSYRMTLEMRDISNFTKTRDDRIDPLFTYFVLVEEYNKDTGEYAHRDHTYIPDTINVTFVTKDGKVFESTYIKYTWAWNRSTGDWSAVRFLGTYAGTTREGPGHPDYEG